MRIVIVGVGALGETIAARAIHVGLPVHAARNTDSAEAFGSTSSCSSRTRLLHRQVEPRSASERFLNVASRLLLMAMFPLALGICIDAYLVAQVVYHDPAVAISISASSFIVFAPLWFVYPRIYRQRGKVAFASDETMHRGKHVLRVDLKRNGLECESSRNAAPPVPPTLSRRF